MTKADLVDRVTSLGDLTRRDGEIIVDTLFESVIGALQSGDQPVLNNRNASKCNGIEGKENSRRRKRVKRLMSGQNRENRFVFGF